MFVLFASASCPLLSSYFSIENSDHRVPLLLPVRAEFCSSSAYGTFVGCVELAEHMSHALGGHSHWILFLYVPSHPKLAFIVDPAEIFTYMSCCLN